jgi:hypothetical protein
MLRGVVGQGACACSDAGRGCAGEQPKKSYSHGLRPPAKKSPSPSNASLVGIGGGCARQEGQEERLSGEGTRFRARAVGHSKPISPAKVRCQATDSSSSPFGRSGGPTRRCRPPAASPSGGATRALGSCQRSEGLLFPHRLKSGRRKGPRREVDRLVWAARCGGERGPR